MRTIRKRKAENQPCRSPSPDVASRNIIRNTQIEVQDIKTKMKQAEQKSIKFQLESSQSQIVPSQLNSNALKYRQVYEELNRMKKENSELRQGNMALNQENKMLRSQRGTGITPMKNSILRRMEEEPLREKTVNWDSEGRILQQELGNERYRNETQQRVIENLRVNQTRLKQEIDRLFGLNRQHQSRIVMLSNSMTLLENDMNGKISELEIHIHKINNLERIIRQKQERLLVESKRQRTPSTGKFQHKQWELTASRNREPQSFYYTSPEGRQREYEGNDRLEDENLALKGQLREKMFQIEKLKDQKENLMLILRESSHIQQSPKKTSTPKFTLNDSQSSPQMQVKEKAMAQKYQLEIGQVRYQNKYLKQVIESKERERNTLLENIQHYKKLLNGIGGGLRNQNCQECIFKDRQIDNLRKQLVKNEAQYRQDLTSVIEREQVNIDEWKRKMRQQETKGHNQMTQMRLKCQKLNIQNQNLGVEVDSMRSRLMLVRNDLQVGEAARLLDENYSFYCELQTNFSSQREEFDRTINELRSKLFVKESQNARLESELSLKAKEVQVLKTELNRLQKLSKQFKLQSYESAASNTAYTRRSGSREKSEKNSRFRKNQLQVLDQFKQGADKLEGVCQNVVQKIEWRERGQEAS